MLIKNHYIFVRIHFRALSLINNYFKAVDFSSRQYSLTDFPFDTYTLLGNYESSTDRYWINTRINYRSQYLLLKRLPLMQALPMTENLHIKTLYTPDFNLYAELGYSVDLIELLNVGAFGSFRKGNFDAFGLRLSFNLKAILH